MKWNRALLISLLFFSILGACGLLFLKPKPTITIRLNAQTIDAQLATTEAELIKGLSNTKALPDGTGMLFVFDHSDTWPFWMKDMNYPLDILWLNDAEQIVSIATNLAPTTYPQTFKPSAPARYALELPGGYLERHSITASSRVSFTLPLK